jgi:hypothetical protein
VPFIVRIDDVIALEPGLWSFVETLVARTVGVTLEVIPYLCTVDPRDLDRIDPDRRRIQVGQHGYAHIANGGFQSTRHEFDPSAHDPTGVELEQLAWGRHEVERRFRERFVGGFSPPFDGLPRWLPAHWRAIGGRFVSLSTPASDPVRGDGVVQAGVDVWDWRFDRPRDIRVITSEMDGLASGVGHTGIVLHPRCLRSPFERGRVMGIINRWMTSRAYPETLENVACATPRRGGLSETTSGQHVA